MSEYLSHILLEAFCLYDPERDDDNCCAPNKYVASYECLAKGCPYFDFTSCEYALCFTGEDSCAERIIIGFDSPKSEVEKWREIAIQKIKEATEEMYGEAAKDV